MYAYVQNNPISFTDPSGLDGTTTYGTTNSTVSTRGGGGGFVSGLGGAIAGFFGWLFGGKKQKMTTFATTSNFFKPPISSNVQSNNSVVDRGGNNPCEQKIANILTNSFPTARFEDLGDGDDFDVANGSNRPLPSDGTETHHHLYPDVPPGNIKNPINIYAPGGGIIVDNTPDSAGQYRIIIFYAKLGKLTNIGLQILHVENFNPSLVGKSTGNGILLGQMGPNGDYSFETGKPPYYPKPVRGYHVHLNAFKWWGIKGKPVFAPDKKTGKKILAPQGDRTNQVVKLADLFCK